MNHSRLMPAVALLAVAGLAAPVYAQQQRTGGSVRMEHSAARAGVATGHTVPRSRPPAARPPIATPYRSYGHYPHLYPSSRDFSRGFSYGSRAYYGRRHQVSWNRWMR